MSDDSRRPGAGASNQDLVADLRGFATFKELRRSDSYRRRASELAALFDEPKVYLSTEAQPRLASFLRVVEWNIERGARLGGIVEALNSHPVLRYADLLLLNELDDGMVRSGNRNVARELSRAVGAHAVYAVEYLEMTKGVGRELRLAGENTAALHGNAILTRHRFINPQLFRLPRCEMNFESAEKRIGGRVGLMIEVCLDGQRLIAATTHLDVVNTPRCRARQMRAFLQGVEDRAGASGPPLIVGGDLNTHTFARGGRVRSVSNALKILTGDSQRLAQRLLRPHAHEPALDELQRFGYETEAFNDAAATSRTIVSSLSDARRLPLILRRMADRRMGPAGLLLEFRLDWLAGRGVRALSAGDITDARTGAASVNPQTLQGFTHKGAPLSDHDPIVADVALG